MENSDNKPQENTKVLFNQEHAEAAQEHAEAAQEQANKNREDFIATLSEENQNKFAAVDKAIKILLDNNVDFYLFPFLPKYNNEIHSCWQYNSLPHTTKYNELGKPTEESKKNMLILNESLVSSVYHTFDYLYINKDFFLRMEQYKMFVWRCLSGEQKRIYPDDKDK